MSRYRREIRILKNVVIYVLLLLFLAFFIAPILWMLLSSLQPQENLMRIGYQFTWNDPFVNFQALFSDVKFLNALKNSVVLSVASTLLTVVFSACGAYAMSRCTFRMKKISMVAIYSIQMGPAVAFLIPLFFIFRQMRMIDNIGAMILAVTTFTIPMSMWIMLGFFSGLPRELEEAAMIDGCNRLTAFVKIVLPLAKPGMISACIVTFISVWGEMLLALPLTLTKATPLTVYASSFSGVYTTNFGGAAAVSVISVLPIIVLMICLRNYLLNGLTEGAVKG